jgi:hypothetical protein
LTILASILVLADEVIDERCHLLHLLTTGLGIVFLLGVPGRRCRYSVCP